MEKILLAMISPPQKKLMRELEPYLPADQGCKHDFKFDHLRLYLTSIEPADMQPLSAEMGKMRTNYLCPKPRVLPGKNAFGTWILHQFVPASPARLRAASIGTPQCS